MDRQGTRSLTAQLAEDLGWLEQHCRSQPELAPHAGQLRLAAALVRNVLGPFLDDQPPAPVHVAVVGGAGAGKSTVANWLSGVPAAEANPQAGFTRHPIAYTASNLPLSWTSHLGFLGPLQRLAHPEPSSLDKDVYQVRRVPADAAGAALLQNAVIWDCPDMTTWAATGYVSRLLEVAGLADVLVYVASDERYNDEVPTQFLHLVLQTGKPVVVCLMKMPEGQAPSLVEHFKRDVLSRLPGGVVGVLAIPHLTPEQLADPMRLAPQYRVALLNQVAVLANPPARARRHTVQAAARYLTAVHEHLTAAARNDVLALEGWRQLVGIGQAEFDSRYLREYLTSEKYRRFDEAMVRLMELLELPGVGKLVSKTLWAVRYPFTVVRDFVGKAFARPDVPSLPEQKVLEEALAGWLDLLRKEAARRKDTHPLWAHVDEGFEGNLADLARERFQQGFRGFQLGQADEVDRTARSIYEDLEKNPVLLNSLRGGKFMLEVASIGSVVVGVATAGAAWWLDLVLAPLAAAMAQQLVEWMGQGYVNAQRHLARQRQQGLMARHISAPLGEWLAQWPLTGGSTFERLQLALRRIPQAVEEIHAAVNRAAEAPVTQPEKPAALSA